MTRREIVHAAVGALAGLLVASAAWSLQKPAAPHAKIDPREPRSSSCSSR